MKETKELVHFVVKLSEAIEKSVKAGQAKEWLQMAALVPGLILDAVPAFTDISKIKEELASLDDVKKAELVAEVKSLDLENDKAEKAVELALVVGVALLDIVDLVKK